MGEYRIMTENELCHARSHKYIKRIFKNGHWNYYYDNHHYNESVHYKPHNEQQARGLVAYRARTWENQFNEDKNSLAKQNRVPGKKVVKNTDERLLRPTTKQDLNQSGRNMAAYKQELNRIDANKPKNRIKRKVGNVQSWLSKALTTKTSVSSAKSKKKGQKWLSKILSTSKTTTHHSFGKTTTYKH